jgi:hypothetical protein
MRLSVDILSRLAVGFFASRKKNLIDLSSNIVGFIPAVGEISEKI